MKPLLVICLLSGCSAVVPPTPADAGGIIRRRPPRPDAGLLRVDAGPLRSVVTVQVLLDGEPVADALVMQGGAEVQYRSDAQGLVTLPLDPHIVGDKGIIASHPEARIGYLSWSDASEDPSPIRLRGFAVVDNEGYLFQDPGEPGRRESTLQCGHCHVNINDDWYASPHRSSASNPLVQDQYAGTAHSLDNAAVCAAAGGRWAEARAAGGERRFRCFLGSGLLTDQPNNCADAACLEEPRQTGRCADCHAPGINGSLGGRDLLEAEGFALDYGVSCDGCHRVESVHPEAAAGIAGRLVLLRPSEEGALELGAGGYLPLTFGPSHDSPNVRMGSVQRDHFRNGEVCMGCLILLFCVLPIVRIWRLYVRLSISM